MKLAKVSEDRIQQTFDHYYVDHEYARTIGNYLVYGFEPGGFFYSVFANDFIGAIGKSHPLNQVEMLKSVTTWITNVMPLEAYGSYQKVDTWLALSDSQRRVILENYGLIFTEQEEVWKTLTA